MSNLTNLTLTDVVLWLLLIGIFAIVPVGCIVQARMKKKA